MNKSYDATYRSVRSAIEPQLAAPPHVGEQSDQLTRRPDLDWLHLGGCLGLNKYHVLVLDTMP